MGRGGAFVAKPTDLTALYYNPAGLNAIPNGAYLGVSLLNTQANFHRDPEGDISFEPVENGSAFFFTVPSIAIAHDFGIPRFKLAAGFITPLSGGYKFEKRGPQRYAVIDSEVGEAYYGIGAAYEVLPGLSIGADALLTWVYAQFEQAYALSIDNKEDHPEWDGFFDMQADAVNRPFFLAGARYARPPFHAGVAYQPPITVDLEGRVRVDQDVDFNGIPIRIHDSKGITVPLKLPAQVRIGAGYDVSSRLYVESNFTYTRWSELKELIGDLDSNTFELTEPVLGEDTLEIPDVVVPLDFKDSYDVRLGADWKLSPRWTLRAGGLYESSAIPPETQTPSLQDAAKIGVGTGFTVEVGRADFDVGSGYLFYEDRTVTESRVTQTNGLEEFFKREPKPVGNGRYEHGIFHLALSTTIRF